MEVIKHTVACRTSFTYILTIQRLKLTYTHTHKRILTAAWLWIEPPLKAFHFLCLMLSTGFILSFVPSKLLPKIFILCLPANIFSRYLGCRESHPFVCRTAKKDWSRKVQSLVRNKHSSCLNGYQREWVREIQSVGEKAREKEGEKEGGWVQQQKNSSESAAASKTGCLGNRSPLPPSTLDRLLSS